MRDTTFALRVVLLSSFAVTACNSGGSSRTSLADASTYEIVSAFPKLTFTNPVDLQNAGDGSDRLFVVEQAGRILVFLNSDTTITSEIFLDIQSQVDDSASEEGLLGLAFDPDFSTNGHYFVYYTIGDSSRVSRFTVDSQDSNRTDMSSQQDIITVYQLAANHNGGQIAFGPDNLFYVGLGDGGLGNDPENNGQDRSTLPGSILRIDVSSLPYSIPPDNPYVNNTMGYREEIYAYGLRNPWRFSFDPVTGWLWCGDVGQNAREEIDLIEKGKNYGWKIMEGSICRPPTSGCSTAGLELPIWEYENPVVGRSVTGGYVYRGTTLPGLVGAYVYADFVAGTIWTLRYSGAGQPVNELFKDTSLNISSFGVDEADEIYICAFDGKIYTIRMK